MDLIERLSDGYDFGQPESGETVILLRLLNGQEERSKSKVKTSLVIQWLRLRVSTAGGTGSISGWRIKIPHVGWHVHKTTHTYTHTHTHTSKVSQKSMVSLYALTWKARGRGSY